MVLDSSLCLRVVILNEVKNLSVTNTTGCLLNL